MNIVGIICCLLHMKLGVCCLTNIQEEHRGKTVPTLTLVLSIVYMVVGGWLYMLMGLNVPRLIACKFPAVEILQTAPLTHAPNPLSLQTSESAVTLTSTLLSIVLIPPLSSIVGLLWLWTKVPPNTIWLGFSGILTQSEKLVPFLEPVSPHTCTQSLTIPRVSGTSSKMRTPQVLFKQLVAAGPR